MEPVSHSKRARLEPICTALFLEVKHFLSGSRLHSSLSALMSLLGKCQAAIMRGVRETKPEHECSAPCERRCFMDAPPFAGSRNSSVPRRYT